MSVEVIITTASRMKHKHLGWMDYRVCADANEEHPKGKEGFFDCAQTLHCAERQTNRQRRKLRSESGTGSPAAVRFRVGLGCMVIILSIRFVKSRPSGVRLVNGTNKSSATGMRHVSLHEGR